MTAVMYDDVIAVSPAPVLKFGPAANQPKQDVKRRQQPAIGGGDPLVDATTRLLSIPLRHVYAVLWRVGVIEVRV